jgi:hypothetical protein
MKRSLPIASASRRTRAMTTFLRKCRTGDPPADRSVAKLTAFFSVVERTRLGIGPHDLSLRNSARLYEPRQNCRLLHIVATITRVL